VRLRALCSAKGGETVHCSLAPSCRRRRPLRSYTHLRRTQPDGNCFYRCLLFALLEALVRAKGEERKRVEASLRGVCRRAAEVLDKSPLEQTVYEDPLAALNQLVDRCSADVPCTLSELVDRFNATTNEATDVNYALWLPRLIGAQTPSFLGSAFAHIVLQRARTSSARRISSTHSSWAWRCASLLLLCSHPLAHASIQRRRRRAHPRVGRTGAPLSLRRCSLVY